MPRHRVVRCGLIVRSIGLNYAVDSGPSKGRSRSIVQVAKKTAPESDPESEKDMNPDTPCLPDGAILEHPFRENDFLVFSKTPSRKPVYPIVKFIRSPYPERGNYQLVYWRIQKKPSGPSRKNDLQAFSNMANEHINQCRAFIFLIENETPCGEVFDYLNAIDGRDTLVGVTFSRENE